MSTVAYAHIELNKEGKPIIAGTRMKVVMIARDRIAGLEAERIRENYPFLTMGQVHSALAYYYDHKEEIDRSIEEQDRFVEEMRSAEGESPLRRKLRGEGMNA